MASVTLPQSWISKAVEELGTIYRIAVSRSWLKILASNWYLHGLVDFFGEEYLSGMQPRKMFCSTMPTWWADFEMSSLCLQFSQKTNKNHSTWGTTVEKLNFLVSFFGELKIAKRHFEVKWPLGIHITLAFQQTCTKVLSCVS